MSKKQLSLFPQQLPQVFNYPFPSTRYQGSKRTLVKWIADTISDLEFTSVLDVFGGTGVVSYMLKNAGKQVVYNDVLAFNHSIGLALIENSHEILSQDEIERILGFDQKAAYPTFIQDNFKDIYFTVDENIWLDRVTSNINHLLSHPSKQALARFALFQACIAKRPYNLFHRANLYMRTAHVERSFGNKTTWDTPFEMHFRTFAAEANRAVFDNGQSNTALQRDALDTPTGADLVYIDPPYLNRKGIGVDYRDFYHFLEGLVDYERWAEKVDHTSKHKRLKRIVSPWNNPKTIHAAFEALIQLHRHSILVISYRDDGIPSKEELRTLLLTHKKHVYDTKQSKKYALSNNRSNELLFIAY